MTVGGRSRPATPSVRISRRRSRFMSSTGPYPCFCGAFSDGIAGAIPGEEGTVSYDVDPVCCNDATLAITVDSTWSITVGFEARHQMDLRGWTQPDRTITASITMPVYPTVGYELACSGLFTTQTSSGNPLPTNGDLFELVVTGLMTASASALMKVNGSTVHSASWSPPAVFYEDMRVAFYHADSPMRDWTVDGNC